MTVVGDRDPGEAIFLLCLDDVCDLVLGRHDDGVDDEALLVLLIGDRGETFGVSGRVGFS